MTKMGRWLLLLFFGIFYLLPLNGRLLWMPDETRYAEISREMLQEREWVVPKLLGLRYFEKPIAGYWWNTLSQWLLGENRFAVRCASALATGLSAVMIYGLAWYCWRCRRRALASSLIYLSSLLVYGIGTYATLDALLTCWITLALCSAYVLLTTANRRDQRLAAIALGLVTGIAFLTKGFIAWAVVAVTMLPYVQWQRRWGVLFKQVPWIMCSLLFVSTPWVIAIAQREPDYWHYFFWVEHIQRFASEYAQHRAPGWFYLPLLLLGSLPWLGLLPAALLRGWQQRKIDPSQGYLLSWLILPLLLFSLAKGKLITYILPCFAPLALLMSGVVMEIIQADHRHLLRINALINFLFGLLGLVILSFHNFIIPHELLYTPEERVTWLIALACCGGWLLVGVLSWFKPAQRWWSAAGCPLLLGLLIAKAIPQSIVDAKLPEAFLQRYQPLLSRSGKVLSNDVAFAVSAAWQLKRSDLLLLDEQGELAYGLGYADSTQRHLTTAQFPDWLSAARMTGDVALLLRVEADCPAIDQFPKADFQRQHNRFLLLLYRQRCP
jgi:4-amino-4-deoxy-L-arabinose transferase